MSGQGSEAGQSPAARRKQLSAWRLVPVAVDAANVKFAGLSRDLRTNTWTWACGRCLKAGDGVIDTMYRVYSNDCQHCNARNLFDFRDHGA